MPYGESIVDENNTDDQNFYKFTGKELDRETGLHYFGARFFDKDHGIWIGPDELREDAPMYSPYSFCYGNPIKYKDPDGRFGIPLHREMVNNAFGNSNLNTQQLNALSYAASYTADLDHMSDAWVHCDGIVGTQKLVNSYQNARTDFLKNFKTCYSLSSLEKVGINLHTVADVYSHSNYIELYHEYAKKNNLSFDINDIPTLAEATKNKDLMAYIEKRGGLRTGTFDNFIHDKFTRNPYAHGNMNLDANKDKGATIYDPKTGATFHDAAKFVAQKDLKQLAKESESNK
jgi:RHS repeat-associated protein